VRPETIVATVYEKLGIAAGTAGIPI
jgi:hypothetical protein